MTTLSFTPFDAKVHDRRTYLGGGDVAAIMGFSKYRNNVEVYHAKAADEVHEDSLNPDMERGRMLEPLVLDRLHAERGGIEMRNGHFRHSRFPFLAGTVDALRFTLDEDGDPVPVAVVEVKCPRRHVYQRYLRDGLSADYILQVQWYLMLTGLRSAEVTLFCADEWQHTTLVIDRDDALIELAVRAAIKFWHEHVVPKVPPTPNDPDADVLLLIARDVASGVLNRKENAEFNALVETFDQTRASKKEMEDLHDKAKANLLAALPSFGVYAADGYTVKLTQSKGRVTIDTKKLKAEMPAVASQYERTGEPGLTLTVTMNKDTSDE